MAKRKRLRLRHRVHFQTLPSQIGLEKHAVICCHLLVMHDESWLIVDTETDGVRTPIHAVEIAAQRMRGWRREGEPFSILLNHDVPIDPGAEAVHGYSRAYLRRHGVCPYQAHRAFHAYAGDLPMVAYNLSFDWNRVLEPEYARLGVPITGRRGFCALTLTRRVVRNVADYRLETMKRHFALGSDRSHRGRNDVETTVALLERIVSPHLHRANIHGFGAVAAFARRTPVATCLESIHGAGPSSGSPSHPVQSWGNDPQPDKFLVAHERHLDLHERITCDRVGANLRGGGGC